MQKNLIIDLDIAEVKAADIFYTSKTYSFLSVKSAELYKKTWREIYDVLKEELNF